MTRQQFIAFLRALLATLLAGLVLWIFQRIGVNVTLPQISSPSP